MGGTYDANTGTIVWEVHVPVEEQVAFYQRHPPRALEGLTARPTELPDHPFDGHGEPVNVAFELACPCGATSWSATGWVDEDGEIGPPLSLHCEACDADHELFDPVKHGHDAHIDPASIDPARDAADDDGRYPDDFPEPQPPYVVVVRFEFGSEVLGGDEAWKGREQDAFTWLTVVARSADGTLTTLLDWECA